MGTLTPTRIQRKRTKGWRMPEGTLYVGRPTKWGNPYTVDMMRQRIADVAWAVQTDPNLNPYEMAAEAFRCDMLYGPDSVWWWYGPHTKILRILNNLDDLRGHDLACWCPLNRPCHADLLLKLANQQEVNT